jgi:hypothetical protein
MSISWKTARIGISQVLAAPISIQTQERIADQRVKSAISSRLAEISSRMILLKSGLPFGMSVSSRKKDPESLDLLRDLARKPEVVAAVRRER